jgi:hypothetical protein
VSRSCHHTTKDFDFRESMFPREFSKKKNWWETLQQDPLPQSHTEDAAIQNANLALLNIVTGVDGPAIVNAHDDKIKYNNNDNDIIAVANINQGCALQ